CGGVHLLRDHPFVDWADGVFRAAEHARPRPLCEAKGELGDGPADPALDALGPERQLVLAVALAPLFRSVGVPDSHAHDRDRSVNAPERRNARDAPAGANDYLAVDLLPQDSVRTADVTRLLRGDRRGFEAEAVLAYRCCGFVDNLVLRFAPVVEREVVAWKVELDPDHVGREHAKSFLQQFLAGLVTFQDDDRLPVHRARILCARDLRRTIRVNRH